VASESPLASSARRKPAGRPAASGRSLPVVNMVKSNAIDWSVVVQVGSQVRAIT
jgi:hypothetical protein